MRTITDWFTMLFLIVSSIGLGYGIDLKKWYGWAFVFSGFMFGVIVGWSTEEGVIAGLFIGFIFALLLIWLGPIMLRRRQE